MAVVGDSISGTYANQRTFQKRVTQSSDLTIVEHIL